MSCGPASEAPPRRLPEGWGHVLADEGFRLFFALGAAYAAIWPALWVLAFGFRLPLAETVSPFVWHAHEMLVGAFGAALIGFLTTAAPEWTDTAPMRGARLWTLALLWGIGRAVGIAGWDALSVVGAAADLAWMAILVAYLLALSWRRRTDRLLAFAFWLALLLAATAAARYAFLAGDAALARQAVHLVGFAYLGLLGIALARITVPVTNLVLDPTEETSPFRPHPGRLNLAPGLVLVAMVGDVAGLSPAVFGFLLFAAGAAFMDRVAEAFIGRAAFQAEILMLAGSSALAGIGLMMAGAARLGAPWSEVTGLHAAFMGGLGLAVYAVFCIAGRLHSGGTLGQSLPVRLGALLIVVATAVRLAPQFGIDVPGPLHGLATLSWSAAFLVWLVAFWPALTRIAPSSAAAEPARAPFSMVSRRAPPPAAAAAE